MSRNSIQNFISVLNTLLSTCWDHESTIILLLILYLQKYNYANNGLPMTEHDNNDYY